MKRKWLLSLSFAALTAVFCANAFATYIVVLKNGTTYKAKSKWTIKGGKAYVSLESGQLLELDPSLLDEPRSEQMTKSGLGDARILGVGTAEPAPVQKQQPSLGASIRLRKLPPPPPQTQNAGPASTPDSTATTAAPLVPTSGNVLSQEVVDKFARAYENVGLFEQKLTSTGPRMLRAELTADSEDKVFNAITATSYLMVRNAGVPGTQIDQVELFMKTTTGGSSGRFQMTRDDAQALDSKKLSVQDYFVRRVLY